MPLPSPGRPIIFVAGRRWIDDRQEAETILNAPVLIFGKAG
jgi:hypothetical protein